MQLTEEQILALAPDESSKKSGKELSAPGKWVSKGANALALWGECQGSGSKPYQTQADLTNIAFKCSCPSRKFPCKHGLGLLLLYARQRDTFTTQEAPAWVTEWLQKRTETKEQKAAPKNKPVDEAAQAKRQQAREQSVEEGISELLLWMKDMVRNGLVTVPGKGEAFFQNMAKRMIDAKAPGLAGMVKTLGNTNFYAEGWQHPFMDQLLRLYLVATGFTHASQLPALLQEDIRTMTGFTQSQDALKEQAGVTDNWLVLGKQITEEDSLVTERNWLYGMQSHQYALVLQFSVRGQGIQFSLVPGITVQAELVYYPSALPLRAIVKQQLATSAMQQCEGFAGWQQVAVAETGMNAVLPFRTERPFIVEQVKPVYYNGQWWLADNTEKLVQIKKAYQHIYPLLSLSGGAALNMAVLGKENVYEPLGVWVGAHYVSIG